MAEGMRVVGTGRFGRKRTTTVYAGQSVDPDQVLLTLDLLRALGWLVCHGVPWPGRPGEELQHLLIGPPGVFVLSVDTQETAVHAAAPGDWQPTADETYTAATDVAAALPGVPVTPVVCFTRAEAFAGVAGSVFLCSLRNVVDVLSHAPVRFDDATLASVRQKVTDGLASPVLPVAAVPVPAPAASPVTAPAPSSGPVPSPEPEAFEAAGAGDRIAEEAARELQRVEAEQLLEVERLSAVEAAHVEDARREAERLELARQEEQRLTEEQAAVVRAEVARRARERIAAGEAERVAEVQKAAELAAGQRAVEAARERRARLQGSRAAVPEESAEAEHEVAAPEQPQRQLALPRGKGVMATIVIGVLAIGGIALEQPIGNAVDSVKALFTERAPARFGEQINVVKTLYHPRLRLHAGLPVAVPGRAEVAIPLTVRNRGEDAWVLETTDLVMLDRVGIRHEAKAGPPIPQGPVLGASTPVAGGTAVTGFLLFDLPRGQTVKELRLTLGPEQATEGAEDPVVWFTRAE